MDALYWDDAYAVALALMERHPEVDPLDVDWETLHHWVTELPDFNDDPDFKFDSPSSDSHLLRRRTMSR